MTTGFRRARGGGAHAHLEAVEARMLASLAAQLVELLRDGAQASDVEDDAGDPLATMVGMGASGPLPRPDDPVLRRLLPDAYPDDEQESSDFRRYTEPGLRDRKSDDAAALITSLLESGVDLDDIDETSTPADIELDATAVAAWLRCLTDLRLALGARLGVEQDDEERWEQMPDDEPAKAMHDVYEWLAYLQETLLRTQP